MDTNVGSRAIWDLLNAQNFKEDLERLGGGCEEDSERVGGGRKEGSFLKVRERVCEHKGSLGI